MLQSFVSITEQLSGMFVKREVTLFNGLERDVRQVLIVF